MTATNASPHPDLSDHELQQLRIDLAAAFRLAVQFDWHESVGNHFSAAASADGKRFLMNPRWRHFGSIRASDLMLLDADDRDVQMAAPLHRLKRREDLLVGEIARRTEEHQGIRAGCRG